MLTAVRRTGRRMGRVRRQLQIGEEKGKRLRGAGGGGGARAGGQGGEGGEEGEGDNGHLLLLSCVQPFATPWTAACQAPPSIEFSRQKYWSG